MSIIKYWKTITFWSKMKDTVSYLGTGGQITLIMADFSHMWNYIIGGATILGILITTWMDDKNQDGVVDMFEDKNIDDKLK